MFTKPVLILGANGQDGFITTALCCDLGLKVIAASRTPDKRLTLLASKYPKLKLVTGTDYLRAEALSTLLEATKISHCFYFASQHGPAGSMKDSPENKSASNYLNCVIPESLIGLCIEHQFSLTLPSSSRIYSGYLNGASENFVTSADTEPWPSDYYGEGKVRLMNLANEGRNRGATIDTPVLFNHDSMFKRDGYVGWAMSRFIYSVALGVSPEDLTAPEAELDLMNAVDVCRDLIAAAGIANSTRVIGSGLSVSVAQLVLETLAYLDIQPSDSLRVALCNVDRAPRPILVSSPARESFMLDEYSVPSALSSMVFVLSKGEMGSRTELSRSFEHLPKIITSFGSRRLHEFSPIYF